MIEQVDDGFLSSRALLVSEPKGVQMLVELKKFKVWRKSNRNRNRLHAG